MARVLVVGDGAVDLVGGPVVVELVLEYDDDGAGLWYGVCSRPGCIWELPERPRQRTDDAVNEATIHVDSCTR